MRNRAYKDFKEISNLLYKIEKSVVNSTKETYPEYKNLCQTIIKHINEDIIELMNSYLDPEQDQYAIDMLYKTKRNLMAMNMTVFDRIDPTSLDASTYLFFQHKMTTWAGYYKDKMMDLMMNYYAICDHDKQRQSIALCCIAKKENRYIREFVQHYKDLGFDNITIYDNNDPDDEKVSDVLQDYIDEGFVDVIPAYGIKAYQIPSYVDFYNNNYTKYDWIAYFDCDEFLILHNDDNIKTYLSKPCFDDADMIHINWKIYDDNDQLHYEDKPVRERFTRVAGGPELRNENNFAANDHIKSIVRTKISPALVRFNNPHTLAGDYRVKDCNGKDTYNQWYISPGVYDSAQLDHYNTKTIEEFLDIKFNRGYADISNAPEFDTMVQRFFEVNFDTDAKRKIVENFRINFEKNYEK